ncbi:cell wall binding repeat-containing protein [Clostridium sp. DL-VIII]|uniref:cadherin-like beta sandwich domain-containing protein n=1 Tax=Clostridium sp. DL-VIII TaxID=641107 RepID=UPI00023B0791|nr:cadherin-like beta sandwich domain-containing protein [Clostridium sp. DL-VIII]EHJ02149.1 cell wall binding repeat-containing protein [Clostridium sp. DL-VIII]
MNKGIQRIIAITLTISAFSIIEPSKYLNILTTSAEARVKGADLKKISLGKGSIDFKKTVTEYTLQLDSSVDELAVRATPSDEDAEVEIEGTEVSEDEGYEKIVNLDKGENKITIKVQNGSAKKTYTLTVKRGHIENKQIYLSNISLSEGEINFSREKTDYKVNVPADLSEISIKAVPEDDDYDVEIDKVTASEDRNYKRTVSLIKGENEIQIKIEGEKDDEDLEKIYTLHINRGGTETSSNAQENHQTSPAGNNNTVAKGWGLNNGQWSYIDEQGNKTIGWKQINNLWYYMDSNGTMKTGWQLINGEWYYLNSNGSMRTGWLQDYDGKWYYLNSSGVMAKNTIINGYKLDSNGAWISR